MQFSQWANFAEDKYYSRQIENLENLREGSYITVGRIAENSPLNQVGIPAETLYFDVSKVRQEIKDRSDPIPSEKIKEIPSVLNNPIVITEYVNKQGIHSVNVYGKLYIGSSPVVVGAMISKGRGGNVINKIQTVHPNRNFANEMAADRILYLTPDKKEARQWFQSLSAQMPLLRGNKSGFIRSIAQEGNEVKSSVSDLGKVQYQLRIEDKNRLDILDRQETRLTADLKTLEKAYAEAIRAEYERSIKPSEETSRRAAEINRKAAKRKPTEQKREPPAVVLFFICSARECSLLYHPVPAAAVQAAPQGSPPAHRQGKRPFRSSSYTPSMP